MALINSVPASRTPGVGDLSPRHQSSFARAGGMRTPVAANSPTSGDKQGCLSLRTQGVPNVYSFLTRTPSLASSSNWALPASLSGLPPM